MRLFRRLGSTLFLWLLVANGTSFGQTSETLERSFSVSGTPDIQVRNEDGRTELSSHAGMTVEIHVTKEVVHAQSDDEAAELLGEVQVLIEQRGDRITVETRHPERDWSFWRERHGRVLVHIDVGAPRASNLDVRTEDGPLTVSGFEGELRLESEDGDLRVSDCGGRVVAVAEDGDVELLSVNGDVRASLEDGDLQVRGRLTRLNAETEDGSIDIRVQPDSSMESDWSVRAEDGRVRLSLPEGFQAELDVSVDDGSIEFEEPVTVEGRVTNRRVTTKLNGGGHELRVRTSDGSVRITKS